MNLVLFGGFVYDAWMTIVIALNWLTYNLIEILYRVFVAVANVNLFGKDIFDAFTNRMYIVVGMAMLFIFAYNIILMIINPEDKKGTGQMSKVVKETIISLVLVILLPTIFNYMAIFQKNILDSQIISQIILGNGTETKDDCDFSKYKSLEKLDDTISINKLETSCKNYNDNEITSPSVRGAYLMTPTLLNAFLYPVNYSMDTCEEYIKSCDKEKLTECDSSKIEDEKDRDLCGKFYYSFKMSQYNGSIGYLLNRSYITDSLKNEDQKLLNFNYLYSLIGGILALVMFASYTIMIGVRVAKLGFLEIIAPIPVMMRIIPKQKEALYDKWLNQLKNTYLDLFIRMIIINFALYAITLIPDVINQLGGSGDDNIVVVGLAKAVVILGILQFAKESPSLIKEFFGSSGRFSIKGGLEAWKTNPGINAARASVYGATTGKGFGKITGALSGISRGAISGYDKAVKGIDKIRTEKDNGSTLIGRNLDRARLFVGMETAADADERRANREVEGKWHITERMKRNEEAMSNAKKIKSTVKDALNKEDTNQTYEVGGIKGNLYQLHKYADGLYQSISLASTQKAKQDAFQKYQKFQQELIEEEKNAVNSVVTKALQAKTQAELDALNDDYNIKGVDVGTIQSAANKLITEASKGALGATYDENGKEIADTGWKETKLDNVKVLGELMGALGAESAQLAQHSQKNFGAKYDRHVANRNVVKKQGSSEKK